MQIFGRPSGALGPNFGFSQDCVRAFGLDSILHPKDEDLPLGTPAWAIIVRSLRELLPLRGFEIVRFDEDTQACTVL